MTMAVTGVTISIVKAMAMMIDRHSWALLTPKRASH